MEQQFIFNLYCRPQDKKRATESLSNNIAVETYKYRTSEQFNKPKS